MSVARKIRRKEWTLGRQSEQIEVPAAEDMDDETFLKHLEKRHADECKIEGYLARHAVDAWIGAYRAFHDRIHMISFPGQHDHYHNDPESWWEDEEEE